MLSNIVGRGGEGGLGVILFSFYFLSSQVME